jgi:hypothetical protein
MLVNDVRLTMKQDMISAVLTLENIKITVFFYSQYGSSRVLHNIGTYHHTPDDHNINFETICLNT